MRPPSKNLMYADFAIQVLLLAPLIIASLFSLVEEDTILLAGFLQFLLGIWQILSSLYTNVVFKLKTRRLHLLLTAAFLISSFGVFYFVEFYKPSIRLSEFVFSLGLIIPQLIAIYYARRTYLDVKQLDNANRSATLKKELDNDILDSEMVQE